MAREWAPWTGPSQHPSSAAAARWLDADGQPLRLTEDEILAFLRDAPVVATQRLSEGINRPFKLRLERGATRLHAIFRTVDIRRHDRKSHFGGFRDRYIYEVASYELSRLLGFGRVPPTVPRTLAGRHGSLQLWIERAHSEARRAERREPVAAPARWVLQRHSMAIFDTLIYNFDRHPGNVLLDSTGRMWWVDHTRSFKRDASLPFADRIVVSERRLWERLQNLDSSRVRARLAPYLDAVELGSLLRRHKKLVAHLRGMIEERGERAVLLD